MMHTVNAETTYRYVSTTGDDANIGCTDFFSPCKTIQAAVDASQDGDTISIAAGTYNENDIQITKGGTLTIEGDDKNTTIIDGCLDDMIDTIPPTSCDTANPCAIGEVCINGSCKVCSTQANSCEPEKTDQFVQCKNTSTNLNQDECAKKDGNGNIV